MSKRSQNSPEPRSPNTSKADLILAAVHGKSGATISDLAEITGWQAHSVRSALSRLRHRGHRIERITNRDGIRLYRLRKTR